MMQVCAEEKFAKPKFPLGREGRSTTQSILRPSSNQIWHHSENTVFPIHQSCCSCGDNCCRLLRRLPITRLGDLSPLLHSSLRDSAVGLVLFLMWGHHHRPHNAFCFCGSGGFGVNAALDLYGSQSRRKMMKTVWKHCCFEVKANDGWGARGQN